MALPYPNHSLGAQASMEQRLRDDYQQREEAPSAPAPARLTTVRRSLLMASILFGFFFSLLDTTIVSTSLLATVTDLQGFRDSYWVVLSYLVTYMGFSAILAKLSDIYGRRNILVSSWIIFAMSSGICGAAVNMPMLIAGRAVQGVGGAGLYSLTTITLPEIGPADKPQIIGPMISVTLSLAFVLGPVLGGTIASRQWRIIYLLNLPAAVAGMLLVFYLYPYEGERQARGASWRRIDFAGSVLLLAATMLLVFALQQAGSRALAWDSPVVVLALVLSGLSWVVFCGWEAWLSLKPRTMEPVFPMHLAAQRVYMACVGTTCLVGFVYMSLILMLPERFQIVNGKDPKQAGISLLPMLGGAAVGCFACGPINRKRNLTSVVVVASCALMLAGTGALISLATASTATGPQNGYQAVFGLGFGLFMSAATMLTTAQAPAGHHAVAQGAMAQARVLGGLVGLAACTVVANGHLLQAEGLSAAQIAALQQSPAAAVGRWPELRPSLQDAYAAAFAGAARVLTGVAGAALIAALACLEARPPPIHGSLAADKDSARGAPNDDMELEGHRTDRSDERDEDLAEPAAHERDFSRGQYA